MELKNSRGYLLPEIIDPGEMQCIMVYVPKDDYYIRAFSGAFHRLGTWQVWEKDGTTRAAEAALVWKNAIDYTMANGWIGECMTPECCEAIVNAINALKLNVTVTSGCGCDVINTYKFPPDWETDTVTYPTPPPLETDPPAVPGGDLCDNAHQAFAEMYEMIAGFVSRLAEFEPYYSIAEYIDTVGTFAPAAGDIYNSISKYLLAQYGQLVADSEEYMLGLKEQIICIIYNGDSSSQATEDIKQLILASTYIPFATREWLYALYSSLNLNKVFDGTLVVRPEFVGSDCSFCGTGDYKITQWAIVPTGHPAEIISETWVGSGEEISFTLVADESHYSAPGNESWLYVFSFDNVSNLPAQVSCQLVGYGGWTAPTNTNHPLALQRLIYGGGSEVVVGLGSVPAPQTVNDVQGVVFHSKTQFSVTIKLTPYP